MLAIADGTVVSVHDGEPEETPGEPQLATRAEGVGDTLVITPESRTIRNAYPLWGSIQNFDE